MTIIRLQGCRRILILAAMAVAGGLLQGCASDTKCVEWRQQPYQHEVCERYSNTGSCAYRRFEQRTREVCTKYEKVGEKTGKK
jgi:hypothetical protein